MKIKFGFIILISGVLGTANVFADPNPIPVSPTLPPSTFNFAEPLPTVLQTGIQFNETYRPFQPALGVPYLGNYQYNPDLDPSLDFLNPSGYQMNGLGLKQRGPGQKSNFGNYDFSNLSDPLNGNYLGLNSLNSIDINAFDVQVRSIRPFEIDLSNTTALYSCTTDSDELEILGSATNWSSCYADRRSYTREPAASDVDLLTRDMEVCNCLRSSPVAAVQEMMNQNFANNKGNTRNFSDRVRTNMNNYWQQNPEELNNEYNNTMNGFYFQANIVSRGDPQFVGIMSQNMFGQANDNKPVFEPAEGGHRLNPRRIDDPSLVRDASYPEGQCVSPLEFLAMRQLPLDQTDGPIIKAELGKEPFNPHDWDYNVLQREYRRLMGQSVGQRISERANIVKLKAKLKYLNRNPMIKYIMGASAADLDLIKNGSSQSDQIDRVFNSTNFTNLKQQMYSIMSMVKNDCDAACIQNYHSEIKKFFDDDSDRILLASLEAHKDSLRRMNEKVNATDYNARTVEVPRQRDIVAEFQSNFGFRSPDECVAGSNLSAPTAIGCLDIYAGYCRTLDKYTPQIQNMSSVPEDVQDNLDQLMANDLETEIDKNQEFQDFNNAVCNTERDGGALGFMGRKFTFFSFKDHECGRNRVPQCELSTPEHYAYFRAKFDALREPDEKELGHHLQAYNQLQNLGTRQMTEEGTRELAEMRTQAGSRDPFANASTYVAETTERRRRSLFDAREVSSTNASSEVNSAMANSGRNYASGTVANSNSRVNDSTEENLFNYSNMSSVNSGNSVAGNQGASTEVPRVQDMDQERRQELLNDWEKEYNAWKENKGNNLSSADQTRDSQLRNEISTLRALLDQQRSISDQQYQLLNDAIAARTRAEQDSVAREQADRSDRTSDRVVDRSAVAARSAIEGDVARGPASIPDQQFNTAGAIGGGGSSGTAGSASLGGGGTSSRSGAISPNGSSDSVAREEAKLVNLRNNSDGSIVIVPSGVNGNNSPNAITLAVSDEQYRILQTNPRGLNLGQIERSIPREQIAQLEKNGEIILLLRNGQNPPYEVKVKKQNNQLVYSVVDQSGRSQVPVRRVNTFSALKSTLELAQ